MSKLYGLDKELAEREAAKRDPDLEERVRAYLEELTGEDVGEDLLESLKDGTILCKAMNAVKPGVIKKIHESSMPFKQMENIQSFLRACRSELGMAEFDLFTTADLYDGKSIVNVTNGLVAFSRAASRAGYTGTALGPKEADKQEAREWAHNPNAGISKLNQGSVETMDKKEIDRSGNPTFGADNAKKVWGKKTVG
ncbi:Calponin-1 [Hondaea fermentalgiana]|uniref:Calponin-1 n=1 Tax=Hondaea fermentalgiana TaxID=2315210 RepID=A0A2R5GIQ5_9STRA|nr:Calponin-1 [Hondaea fermentalgiana]|eukprot:GBG30485.1 Calponin-1 [Hondaea fermentalgiana]